MPDLDLLTIIVQRKDEQKAIDAAIKAGAPGVTYFHGRGTGVRQRLGALGNFIDEEKVVILTAVPAGSTAAVVKAVRDAVDFDKSGNAFMCVQRVQNALGLL